MFAATREAMIVTAIVLVLVAPSIVRGSLERAGISSFAGVEFGIEEVVDASQQVAVAEEQVAMLLQQLANVETKLEAISTTGRSANPEEVRQLASAVHELKSRTDSVDNSLMKTTRKMNTAIHLMPPEKLRELAAKNARRQEIIQQSAAPPPIQSANLESLLIGSEGLGGVQLSR
jgi:capsule polysaccharide export protein KpsE/RkpR